MSKPASRLAPMLAGVAGIGAVIAIIGSAVAVFFNPLWIGFEQARAGVPTITGYTQVQVRAVTDSILADLFLGPAAFDVSIGGQPVLGAAERSHMDDVRTVLLPLVILAVLATTVCLAVVAANWRNAIVWRAIARGTRVLALVGIVGGAAVLFFFDAAFLLFHRLFFPQGNFSFDPRTQRLTQLFPEQFWTETSIGIVIVGLAIALVATVVARRRAASLAG